MAWRTRTHTVIPLVLAAAGCGDDSTAGGTTAAATGGSSSGLATTEDDPTSDSADDDSADDGSTDDDSTGGALPGFRDTRYCEVLPVYAVDGELQVEVFNSLGYSDCPQAAWDALDATALAAELDATTVILNGPRHFLMDMVEANNPTDPELHMFGDLTMRKAATLTLPADVATGAYAERQINRDTTFSFDAGAPVFELTGPDGGVYVMQSYSLQVDAAQTLETLGSLGERLQPADGWTFSTRILDAPLLVVTTDGVARVVQDELDNTYQRHSD